MPDNSPPNPATLNSTYFQAGDSKIPVYEVRGYLGYNRMTLRTGAACFGRGQFLLTGPDYLTLQDAADNDGTVTLVMEGNPGPGVQIKVVLAIAEALSLTASPVATTTDLMLVTVYDQRAMRFNPLRKAYNVIQDGFSYSSGFTLYTSTKNGGSNWTWAQILSDLSITPAANNPADLPTWTPYNLIWDNVPAMRVLDDIAARLFYVVGFDWTSNTLALFKPGSPGDGWKNATPNNTLDAQAFTEQGAWLGGGGANRDSKRLPGTINVTFQAVNADDSSDPFAHRLYSKSITTGSGSDLQTALHVGENLAIWQSSAWANQSDLDAIATDVGKRAVAFMSQRFGKFEYAGIWPFRPDGFYREVTWISDSQGARTVVCTDNRIDFTPIENLADPVNLAANQEVIGLGATNTNISASGTKQVWAAATSQNVVCQITSKISGQAGKYNATIYKGTATDGGSGDLTLPAGLTVGQNIILYDSEEDASNSVATGTHRLLAGTYVVAQIIGKSSISNEPVALVRGGVGDGGSPKALPAGGYSAADTTNWHWRDDGKGAVFQALTNFGWDSGSGNLFFNTRSITFDSRGALFQVLAEYQTTIATTDCSSAGGGTGGATPAFMAV